MIVFLTLLYVVALVVMIKLKIIRLTLWWKISPLVWMLLLFIVLFIPMQWGAPADGYTTGVTLEPGQRVGVVRTGSVLNFVVKDQTKLVAWINQIYIRHVKN